jgi:hypothetical protein
MKRQCVIVDNDCEHPPWVEDVAHKLAKCWRSGGGTTILVNQCEEGHWHLVCCPSLRELVGGENDGGQVYARFQLNIGKVMRFFDTLPKVIFDAAMEEAHPFVVFIGKISGEEVQLAVVSGPVPGQPATELAYTQGPKKGKVERRLPREGEGDYDAGSE